MIAEIARDRKTKPTTEARRHGEEQVGTQAGLCDEFLQRAAEGGCGPRVEVNGNQRVRSMGG
jgi:hypothetical protein